MSTKKITTIEGLAELIHETMASKEDVNGLEGRMNTRFDTVDMRLENLDARVGRIEADIKVSSFILSLSS